MEKPLHEQAVYEDPQMDPLKVLDAKLEWILSRLPPTIDLTVRPVKGCTCPACYTSDQSIGHLPPCPLAVEIATEAAK